MSTTTPIRTTGGRLEKELEELFRNHCQFVYRTAYSVLRNRPDAEDVVQNLFLKLLDREIPVDLTKYPQAYFYRAAVNAALNVVRSRKKVVAVDDFDSFDRPAPASSADADDARRQKLIAAIAQLRPKAAEILILRYAHNYSDAQIAKMLGKSRGYVAVTLYRARAYLKRLVGTVELEKINGTR
jgi:RNA polymerase sigma-70 factor (ECF subfamily)